MSPKPKTDIEVLALGKGRGADADLAQLRFEKFSDSHLVGTQIGILDAPATENVWRFPGFGIQTFEQNDDTLHFVILFGTATWS